MRVLVFAPFAKWAPHLETDLELAEKHLLAGDEVVWISCAASLTACEPNPSHSARSCAKCTGRANTGLDRLSGKPERIDWSELVTDEDRRRVAELPTSFDSHAEIKALRFEGLDLGYATLSSVVWCAKDANVDLGSDLLARFLRSAALCYLGLKRYLKAHPVDRVYLFNGRMAVPRAALRAAQELGVPAFVHERGCDLDHYSLTPNAMPHEIRAFTQRVQERWAEPSPPIEEKTRIAEQFYESRSRGAVANWSSYTDSQDQGKLPADWDVRRRNVVIYSSSEYEYAAIGEEWKNHLFDIPTEGIIQIAQALSEAGQVHLTIRMHPNPSGSDSTSARRLLALDLPGVSVVAPRDEVCSYGLMHAAEKVVVTSSTVGMEATYFGKPSILAGRSLYCELGGVHQPQTFPELIDVIHDPNLGPADRLPALQYGYDQSTFGTRFEHFEAVDLFRGRFKGERIKPQGADRLRVRIGTASDRLGRWVGARP